MTCKLTASIQILLLSVSLCAFYACKNELRNHRKEYLQIIRIKIQNDTGSKSTHIVAENDSEASAKVYKNICSWENTMKFTLRLRDSLKSTITSEVYDEENNDITQKLATLLSEGERRDIKARSDKSFSEFELSLRNNGSKDSVKKAALQVAQRKNAKKIAATLQRFRVSTRRDHDKVVNEFRPLSAINNSTGNPMNCYVRQTDTIDLALLAAFDDSPRTVQFVIDDNIYEISPGWFETEIKSEKEKNIIKALSNASKVRMTYPLNSANQDHYFTRDEIKTIKETVDLYKFLGGKL